MQLCKGCGTEFWVSAEDQRRCPIPLSVEPRQRLVVGRRGDVQQIALTDLRLNFDEEPSHRDRRKTSQ